MNENSTKPVANIVDYLPLTPEHSQLPDPEKNIQLGKLSQILYDKAQDVVDKIPPGIPVIKDYLNGKLCEYAAQAALTQGVDMKTGKKIPTFEGRMKAFAANELDALLHQGKAIVDILTLGSGSGSITQAEMAAKWLTSFRQEGAEKTLLGCIAPAMKQAVSSLPEGLVKGTVIEMANMFGVLTKHDVTREAMTDWLKQQSWWTEFKNKTLAQANPIVNEVAHAQ